MFSIPSFAEGIHDMTCLHVIVLFRINPENKLGNLKGVVPLGVLLTITHQRKGMQFEDLVSSAYYSAKSQLPERRGIYYG